MKHILRTLVLSVAVLTTMYSPAFAVGSSGFELGTNTARSLGRANAVSADPGEPAAVVFNPAGLTSLAGNQASLSTSLITLSTQYDGTSGNSSEDSATLMSTVPSFFLSLSTPNKDLKLGMGVNAPFGLTTQYSSTGNFKYTSNYNQIKTVAYNLSAAYQVREWISVGLGFTYLDGYTKQVGKINNAGIFGAAIIPDSDYELDVEGSGYGMNMGVQIKPAEKHYLGIFYRTETRTKQTGSISIDGIPIAFGLGSFYNSTTTSFNTNADTDITFPGSVTIGYKYQATPKWDVEADFTWTGWSAFDRVDIAFDSTSAILASFAPVHEGFRNTFSMNLGTSYKMNDVWTISGGYWYYAMAANEAYYSNVIPDGDRHAGSIGLVYNHKNYSIGLSYAALFITKTEIDNNVGAANHTTVDGEYSSFVNILSMDAVYKF